jgi:putative Holliday junction resolvase
MVCPENRTKSMTIGHLREIVDSVPKGKRLMGLDIGKKTIGIALSDTMHTIATPMRVIIRKKFTIDILDIENIVQEYDVKGFVLGYPVNMDGSEGPRCESIRHFAQEFVRYPQIVGNDPWVSFWDERLSTSAVDRFMIDDVDMSRTKRKQVVDKLAAQFILQGALDFISMPRA